MNYLNPQQVNHYVLEGMSPMTWNQGILPWFFKFEQHRQIHLLRYLATKSIGLSMYAIWHCVPYKTLILLEKNGKIDKDLHPQPVFWKVLATSVPELQMFEAGFDEGSKIDGIGPLHSTFLKESCSLFVHNLCHFSPNSWNWNSVS